jgi:hypothetical protein
MNKFLALLIWLGVGAIVGAAATADLKAFGQWLGATWPWRGMALGAVIAGVLGLVWIFREYLPFSAKLSSIEIKLPLVGKLKMKLTPIERSLLCGIFFELATRVSTQRLADDEGILREALESLYGLFKVARADLATTPPAELGKGQISARAYVLSIINAELRPFLSRWHPLLRAWERTGLAEASWPLAALCRRDLAVTRERVLWHTWELGTALEFAGIDRILPPRPQAINAVKLTPAKVLTEAFSPPLLDARRTKVAWRIFVETASRISTQALAPETGLLSEAIKSLYDLFVSIRGELKGMVPTPPMAGAGQSVETLSLRLLNSHLRPFLAKWHPRLEEWMKQNRPETDWPKAQLCRRELEEMRSSMVADVRKLGQLAGVQNVESFLGG